MVHGRAGGGGAAGVRALIRGLLEEVVLQGVEGRDARLGVVVEHAQDQILELQVVARGVTLLPGPPPTRTPGLHPQNLMESPCGWGLVLLIKDEGKDGEVERRGKKRKREMWTNVRNPCISQPPKSHIVKWKWLHHAKG